MTVYSYIAFLVLYACDAPPSEETASATDDTADTASIAPFDLEVVRGACGALLDPWSAADARAAVDASALASADAVTLLTVFNNASARAEGDCPTVTDTEGGRTISGTCTTPSGWSYAGTAFVTNTDDSGGSSSTLQFEDFSLLFGDADDLWRFSADGGFSLAEDGAVTILTIDMVYGLERTGTLAGPGDAYVSLVGDWSRSEAEGTYQGASYVRVLSSPTGVAGDLCATWDQAYDVTCDGFVGTVTLDGAGQASLVTDGETCSECARVTLDGTFAGTVCE